MDDTTSGLFSTDNFRKHMIPRLLQIFCVRDAQIRLLLLKYFQRYIRCFTVDELESHILPEVSYLMSIQLNLINWKLREKVTIYTNYRKFELYNKVLIRAFQIYELTTNLK